MENNQSFLTKFLAFFATVASLFISTALFAQEAAAEAAAPAVDMEKVNRNALFYVLLFLLLCMFIALIGKAFRIYELTTESQGKAQGINWDRVNAIIFVLFLTVGLYGTYWEYSVHGKMILPEAASEHGKHIDQMFEVTLILTTIVFVLTHLALFLFSYFYRYRANKRAYYYPHNSTIERIWTIVPSLVLLLLVLKGFMTWREIFYKAEDPKNRPISIEVTSSQFMWDVRYAGPDAIVGKKNYKLVTSINNLGIDFNDRNSLDDLMADEIVLPVNKPVRFILNSKDVIHSFYMPHFRVQLNTVPGMFSNFEFTPTITTEEMRRKTNDPKFNYILLCSKICGTNHFNMQKMVRVVSEAEYKVWLTKQVPYLTDDLRKAFNIPLKNGTVAAPADSTATASVHSLDNNNQLAIK
jgi:cytochrome c oxidase subunit 2